MKAVALGYHDVFDGEPLDDGGLRPHAAHYALSLACFRRHLDSIPKDLPSPVGTLDRARAWSGETPVLLTFDDGALGSYTFIADELEQRNARGHFFVVSSWIGLPGFMTRDQIRDLRRRGHVIGSHSRSHPERMAALTREQLQREWSESCEVLSGVLGEPCAVASVPNGYYSRVVRETAAAAGITVLFNSEPTTVTRFVDGCLVVGRYAIKAGDPPEATGALIERIWPRLRQKARWDAVKAAKAISGTGFLEFRNILLSRKDRPTPARRPGER